MNVLPVPFMRRFFLLLAFATTGCTLRFDTLAPPPSYPAPAITSLTPNEGFAGDLLTIAGTNLSLADGTTTVTFPGGATGNITTISATQIQVKVPDEAGNGTLTVATQGGKATTATFTFLGPGEPRSNTLAGTLGFQAQPQEVTITEAGTVIAGAVNPIDPTQLLVLRAATGVGSPVFTETAEIPTPSEVGAYAHVYALGTDVITVTNDTMTEWQQNAGAVPSPANHWSMSGTGIFTVSSDPNWATLVAAPLTTSSMLVSMLVAPGADPTCMQLTTGWCAAARQVTIATSGTPTVGAVHFVMAQEARTTVKVTPSLAVSSDGGWATLVAPDGHVVGFVPPGTGTSLDMPIGAVAAVPSPLNQQDTILAGLDGSIVHVDSSGNMTALLGPGPVPSQLVVAPGNVVALSYPGISALTLLTLSQASQGAPVTATTTGIAVPFVPSSLTANSAGTAVIWNSTFTSVAEISLTRQVIEWSTDIPFVAQGGAAFSGGVVLNYVSPDPYLVGLSATNLTTPSVSVQAPIFDASVAGNNARHIIWGYTGSAAESATVSFEGTPAITPAAAGTAGTYPPEGSSFSGTILQAVPANDADYFLVSNGTTVSLTNLDQSRSVNVGPTASTMLAATDPTRAVIYVLLGSTVSAVDTQTFQVTGQLNLATALSETGLVGQTLNVTRDGSTALVTDGHEIALLNLPGLTLSTSVPTAIDGASISPDGRYLYFVLSNAITSQASLARMDVSSQVIAPLFELPPPGPELLYAGLPTPGTQYSLLFSVDGTNLFVNDQYSGEVLDVQ